MSSNEQIGLMQTNEEWLMDYDNATRQQLAQTQEVNEMGLQTENNGGDFENPPPGVHVARCIRYVDLGTHMNPRYGTLQHVVRLIFELPNELMKEGDYAGKPFLVSKQYTLSHNEKSNLRQDIESWYGKKFDTDELDKAGGFDLDKLLDRTCQVNLLEEKGYTNIKAIMPITNGTQVPDRINDKYRFVISEWNEEIFGKLSEKTQHKIKESKEYKGEGFVPPKTENPEPFDDDIPF